MYGFYPINSLALPINALMPPSWNPMTPCFCQVLHQSGQFFWHYSISLHAHLVKLSSACKPLGDELFDFVAEFLPLKQMAYSALGEDLADPNKLQVPVQKALTSMLSKIQVLCTLSKVTTKMDLYNVRFVA